MRTLNFSFDHDGKEWRAQGEEINAQGANLSELDADIRIRIKRKFPKLSEKIKVTMEFDYNKMPFWLTQYHPYYMHRVLVIEP